MSCTRLKEPLQPPDLEETLPNQHGKLKNTPPLDARVGALSRVPVRPLPDHNVALLVFDLRHELGHLADCQFVSSCSYVCPPNAI